ncbi:MAG: hypothetical protein RL033_6932, partial [Pseudomonadota bacterium]|jgi:hypothetical protein
MPADNYAPLWFSLSADRVGAEIAAGGTQPLGPLDLALDVLVSQPFPGVIDPKRNLATALQLDADARAPSARLELGPALSWGGFFVLPKIGLGYDFERQQVTPLVPQLQAIIQAGPAYSETWLQLYLYDLFEAGEQDTLYAREALLVALDNQWAVGLQLELSVAVQNAPSGNRWRSFPIGAVANLEISRAWTVGLFAGWETQPEARNGKHDGLAGRAMLTGLW